VRTTTFECFRVSELGIMFSSFEQVHLAIWIDDHRRAGSDGTHAVGTRSGNEACEYGLSVPSICAMMAAQAAR